MVEDPTTVLSSANAPANMVSMIASHSSKAGTELCPPAEMREVYLEEACAGSLPDCERLELCPVASNTVSNMWSGFFKASRKTRYNRSGTFGWLSKSNAWKRSPFPTTENLCLSSSGDDSDGQPANDFSLSC